MKANLLGMRACGSDWKNRLFVGDNINVKIRTSVASYIHHGQAICQLFEMKRLFLFIGNLAASIV